MVLESRLSTDSRLALASELTIAPQIYQKNTVLDGDNRQGSSSFPTSCDILPTKKEFSRMILFVSVHLVLVLALCCVFWVPRGGDNWSSRFIFSGCSVVEALLRVAFASWWLKAASLKLALVFTEIDVVTLIVVGLSSLFLPALSQSQILNPVPPGPFGAAVSTIFLSATVRETCKFVGYIIPFVFRQTRCASHLLFAGATSGALNMLYGDIFSGLEPENSTLWQLIVVSLLYTMMFTLWTSMGAAILCQIKQKRLRVLWSPLVLIVPIFFHAGYLMAVFDRTFSWQWALITISYWVVSGVSLKFILTGVMGPETKPTTENGSAFVSAASPVTV